MLDKKVIENIRNTGSFMQTFETASIALGVFVALILLKYVDSVRNEFLVIIPMALSVIFIIFSRIAVIAAKQAKIINCLEEVADKENES